MIHSVESQKKKIQQRKEIFAKEYKQKKLSLCRALQVRQQQKESSLAICNFARKSSLFYEKKPVNTSYSASRVRKEILPFHKLIQDQPAETPKINSEKELSHINYVNNLKSSTRYGGLKIKASNAIKNKMIFTINVNNGDVVRKALTDRGWIEKLPSKISETIKTNFETQHGKNLERQILSDLVSAYPSNIIWDSKENSYHASLKKDSSRNYHYRQINATRDNQNRIQCEPIRNHLKTEASWTTKEGLRQCMKKNIMNLNIPKIYSLRGHEYNDFLLDYKITACTSLLKWILTTVANKVSIFTHTGNISTNVIVFAINRCKEYLRVLMEQNHDVHNVLYSKTTTGQWNSFLSKYFILIAGEDVFHTEQDHILPLFIVYAKLLLKEIQQYRPLVSSEGYRNVWIMKPSISCTGKTIRMASDLTAITDWTLSKKSSKYFIQKYIEEPMLIHETKFVIRQYYLVTSICPLVIWMYRECYLKFSSQKYSLKEFHESIHFTNYAIQKKNQNSSNQHSKIPKYRMWNLDTFKKYLVNIGHATFWDRLVYPAMKDTIINTMLSSQDPSSCDRPIKCFGLYVCDFILDKDYMPWLIDINSCSNPKPTTEVTAQFYPEIVQDVLRVVIDVARSPKADTGKFECVYPRPTQPQNIKSLAAFTSFTSNKYSCKLQSDSQPDTLSDTQTKPIFKMSKCAFNKKSKAALEYKVPKEPINEQNVHLDDKSNTSEHKIETEDSIASSVSKHVEDLSNEVNSDQNARDGSKYSKNPNLISVTSSGLLHKVHAAGSQFARLLLTYFLIYLQSITGISTLPHVVLESQKLRDSLCLQISSPSRFFANSGHDTEKLT